MTPLKTSVLIFLILGVFCQCITAFYPSRSKECCYSYKRGGPLPVPLIAKYYKTPSDCALDAVVFVMKSKKTVCANPRESWVRRTIAILQRNK
ncbi:PREDICTED: C-C motif chemokine 17 [Gekko japonicus]|uniref:C-C motif chemokine n=1 Tax=Gekko japonicus TaxID=146911 RepID=A0ABM1K3M3_GEKJA|nr:PREDICTED: C-C motif chemokine 17 [Gekko japonicus]